MTKPRVLLPVLVLLAALPACRQSDTSWPALQRRIGADFPDVRQLSLEAFERDVADRCLLVDVRAGEEYAVSHLRGAVNLRDAAQIAAAYRDSGKDSIVLYCSVGYRSSRLAAQLEPLVDCPVYNLKGSIFAWANAGKPVYRGTEQVHTVHPYDAEWGRLLDKEHWPATTP